MGEQKVIYLEGVLIDDGGFISKLKYNNGRVEYAYYKSREDFEQEIEKYFPHLMKIN